MNIYFKYIPVLLTILLSILIMAGTVQAQNTSKKNGVGLLIGEPTGITYKRWLTDESAFDVGLAWSVSSEANVTVHSDYLFHKPDAITLGDSDKTLPFYYGAGLRLRFGDDDTEFGVRIPLGVAYYLKEKPIELFSEIVPLVDLAPDTEFEINGNIGVRYYF